MIKHFCGGSVVSGIGVGLMIGAWLSIRADVEPFIVLFLGVILSAVGGLLVRRKARQEPGDEEVEV